jgi:hypothetical protein
MWRILVFIFFAALLKYTITDSQIEESVEFANYMEVAAKEERDFKAILNQLNVELISLNVLE